MRPWARRCSWVSANLGSYNCVRFEWGKAGCGGSLARTWSASRRVPNWHTPTSNTAVTLYFQLEFALRLRRDLPGVDDITL